MKVGILAGLSVAILAIGNAFGQCTAWNTLNAISENVGPIILEQRVVDGSDVSDVLFLFDENGPSVWVDGPSGARVGVYWTDESDGSGTLQDAGIIMTVRCQGSHVLIDLCLDDGDTHIFGVTANGETFLVGPHATRRVYNQLLGTMPSEAGMLTSGQVTVEGGTYLAYPSSGGVVELTPQWVSDTAVDEDVSITNWVGVMSYDSESVLCAGVCIATESEIRIMPVVSFDDPMGPLPPICTFDPTAVGEYSNLNLDYASCDARKGTRMIIQETACGIIAIPSCILCLSPVPGTCPICAVTAGCFFHGFGNGVLDYIDARYEYNRVKQCICNNVITRSNGGTTGACTFSCP